MNFTEIPPDARKNRRIPENTAAHFGIQSLKSLSRMMSKW